MTRTSTWTADSRDLTPSEKAMLDALLGVEFEGVADLRAQAPSVRVVGGCACGCPSVDFIQPSSGSMPVSGWSRIAPHQVGLFVRDGLLAGIDYTVFDDSAAPGIWPPPSEFVLTTEPPST